MTEQEFYLVEELAERLRVSKMTVYRYLKDGKLNAHKIGKEYRISKKDFNKFLKQTRTNL